MMWAVTGTAFAKITKLEMDTEKKFVITLKIAKWRHLLFVICTSTFMQASCTDITCDVIFDQNQCAQKIIIRHQMRSHQFSISYIDNVSETVLSCRDGQPCTYDGRDILINMSNGDLQLFISANRSCMSKAFEMDEATKQEANCSVSREESEAKKNYNTKMSGGTTGPEGNNCTNGSDGNATSPSCSQDNKNKDVISLPIAMTGISILVVVLFLCIYFYRKKKCCFRRKGLRNGVENIEEGGKTPDKSTTAFLSNEGSPV